MLRKRRLEVSGVGGVHEDLKDEMMESLEETSANRPKLGMLFTKASTALTDDESKLYSQLQKDHETNLVRLQRNAFKGKKYGIGAKLMAKMGYVEGEGLGVNHQGILVPVETQVRKLGVGIGDDTLKKYDNEDYDLSSDEEYYKEVPKKSLFQIIVEIESKNVKVPQWIKTLSDSNSELANKPFIALQKENEENDVNLDEIRVKLNDINDKLDELLIYEKMIKFEINELENDLKKTDENEIKYNELIELLKLIDVEKNERDLVSFISKLNQFTSLPDIDIPRILIKILKPIVTETFNSWSPLNLNESESVIETLKLWKSVASTEENLDFNELSYFDSLISSLWLSKMTDHFENWSINQPNLAITLLLDWSEIIPDQIFSCFVHNSIIPKLIKAINDWNHKTDNDDDVTPPYVWIFEWLGVLSTEIDEVEREFNIKYRSILNSWDIEKDGNIPGLNSFKEIYGQSKYKDLINDSILRKIITYFLNHEFVFDENDVSYEFNLLKKAELFFNDTTIVRSLWDVCFWNSWIHSIYSQLTNSSFIDFKKFANYIQDFYKFVQLELDFQSSSNFRKGLDLINQYMEDPSNLKPKHKSYTLEVALSKILKSSQNDSKDDVSINSIPNHKLSITFKNVLEKYCDDHNLFLTPMNSELLDNSGSKSLKNNRGNLFYKISFDPMSKKGKIGYIEHDVLFLKKRINDNEEKFWPISIDELVNEIRA